MASVEFGMTQWGRAWLRVIERISSVPNPKLPNARRLARDVGDEVRVEPGRISATIDGKTVEIEVPLWTEDELAEVKRVLVQGSNEPPRRGTGGAPPRRGTGGAGDLPDSLVAELTGVGVDVACTLDQLRVTCTCRSRVEVCVHALAAVYGAVMVVDQQPTRALELRTPEGAADSGILGGSVGGSEWIALTNLDADTFFTSPRRG